MANVKIRVPAPLQKMVGNKSEVPLSARTVAEALAALEAAYPGVKEKVCDESGKVRKYLNLYVNDEDIRFLKGEGTELKDGDEVSIIPAIAGGR
ncbi:MAG: ubiquitin-like small modifier protein 1 [Planctomycetota bacterium]